MHAYALRQHKSSSRSTLCVSNKQASVIRMKLFSWNCILYVCVERVYSGNYLIYCSRQRNIFQWCTSHLIFEQKCAKFAEKTDALKCALSMRWRKLIELRERTHKTFQKVLRLLIRFNIHFGWAILSIVHRALFHLVSLTKQRRFCIADHVILTLHTKTFLIK